MKGHKALKALLQGKRIRHERWARSSYVWLGCNKMNDKIIYAEGFSSFNTVRMLRGGPHVELNGYGKDELMSRLLEDGWEVVE